MVISQDPDFSLYFHIPFCKRKCDYCHFFVLPEREQDKDLLMQGFKQEWQRWAPLLKKKRLASIYFGGGTPFLLGPERIYTLLSWIYADHSPPQEITLEANPESIEA